MDKIYLRKIILFVAFFCLMPESTSPSPVPRWVACEFAGDFRFSLGSVEGVPNVCLSSCLGGGLMRAFITGAAVPHSCSCANLNTMVPSNVTKIMEDFRICNSICRGGPFLKRCGSTSQFNFGMWYENSEQNGTYSINMCYNKTTNTELLRCREERTSIALFMGRSVNGSYKEVIFVSPCGNNNGGCASVANCEFNNTTGYRTCVCRQGYEANTTNDMIPGFKCNDIDECVPPNTNDCNVTTSICVNTIGSFKCRCREAFIDQDPSNPGRNCTPVFDECRMRIRPRCALNAVCTNNPTPPGHMCSCPTGYMGDGLLEGTGCIDINECLNNNGGCSMTTQTCENTIGSRICVCNIGLFEDDMGNCVPPSATVECSGSEPAATDRKIIFTAMCRTAFLFGCNDNTTTQRGVRIPQTSTGPYDRCVNNMLQNNFNASLLNDPSTFGNAQGINFLQPTTTCNADSFSVTFFSAPAIAAGFNLTTLFMGGLGDYAMVSASHQNVTECKGQVFVQNGLKYKFEIFSNSTNCGTIRSTAGNMLIYSGAVRGAIGDVGAVVTRGQSFFLAFSCSYPINQEVSNNPDVFFYDLKRRKRDIEVKKDFNFPGASDLSLTMSLRKDGEFSELNQIPLHRKVGEMVHIEAILSSEEPIRLNRFSYGLKVLRCWETLTKDGVSLIYKNIVADSCNSAELENNQDYSVSPTNTNNNFKFSFKVKSIYGGIEDVYVSCLFDVLSPGKTCRSLETTPRSLHIDPYMVVRTVGPIKVHDICGGKNRGGCEHYCREKDNKPICYCVEGFEIDPNDPRKCLLRTAITQPSTNLITYVIIVIAAIAAVLMLIFIIVRIKGYNSNKKGMYRMNEPGEKKLVEEPESSQ